MPLGLAQNASLWRRLPEAMQRLSREEIERICIRNLLGAREERVFFKDLDSRFLAVSAGWLEAEDRDVRWRR